MFLTQNLKKILSFGIFLFVLILSNAPSAIAMGGNTTPQGSTPGLNNCVGAAMDAVDAVCRCPKTMCRLSKIGDPDFGGQDRGQGTGRVITLGALYMCIEPGKTVKDYVDDQIEQKFRGNLNIEGQNQSTANKELSDFQATFYTDEFSRLPNNQTIPITASCRLAGELANPLTGQRDTQQAYWFNEKYFDSSGSRDRIPGDCSPLFVNKDLFGNSAPGVQTFFGCLPATQNGFVAFIVRLLVGISGMVTFIIILLNILKIMLNSTNPEAIADGRKKLVAAVATFVVLLLSLSILNIVGLQILDLGSFGGGILNIIAPS